MSLRTKILLTLFLFTTLVFALLTLNLLVDFPRRAHLQTRRQAEFLSRLVDTWLMEMLARADPEDPRFWDVLSRRMEEDTLFRDYLIVQWPVEGGGKPRLRAWSEEVPPGIHAEELEIFKAVAHSRKTDIRGTRAYTFIGALPRRPGGPRYVVLGRLDLAGTTTPVAEVQETIRSVLFIMITGTALILLTTYILLDRFVLRPLRRLAEAATAVAEGRTLPRLPEPPRSDEVARTFRAFNQMVGRLEEYHRRLKGEIRESRRRLKETHHRLATAQRLSSTGMLAAGIAHEINNPLSGLINMVRQLRDKNPGEPERRRKLDLVLEGLDRIRVTVERVLRFAPRPVKIQEVSLADVFQRVKGLVEHRLRAKGIRFETHGLDRLPGLRGDPGELQQLFLNLVLNAVDACPEAEGRIRILGEADGRLVTLRIVDNGSGMSEEQMERCFLPFQTTKGESGGTGLGLPVAKSLAEAYGGDIILGSREGEGTTVYVLLPVEGRRAERRDPFGSEPGVEEDSAHRGSKKK